MVIKKPVFRWYGDKAGVWIEQKDHGRCRWMSGLPYERGDPAVMPGEAVHWGNTLMRLATANFLSRDFAAPL
jgi:hypothetical protein